MTTRIRLGFRVVGDAGQRRRLVDHAAAFLAYCDCDTKAEINREGFLSAFTFGPDFQTYWDIEGREKGFTGLCSSPYIWLDLDGEDLEGTLLDARKLASYILDRYRALDEDALLIFFSGSKGFHLGLPITWESIPSATFPKVAKSFAEKLARDAGGVRIDSSIYNTVRIFRAPNSKHGKTGLHKRRLWLKELLNLDVNRIRDLAKDPIAFDLSGNAGADPQAANDWLTALEASNRSDEAVASRKAMTAEGSPLLNRSTLDFITDGADQGDRARRLFSAAANLAEFPDVRSLAFELLTPAGLDSGLNPSEVKRQIECGLRHAAGARLELPPAKGDRS